MRRGNVFDSFLEITTTENFGVVGEVIDLMIFHFTLMSNGYLGIKYLTGG